MVLLCSQFVLEQRDPLIQISQGLTNRIGQLPVLEHGVLLIGDCHSLDGNDAARNPDYGGMVWHRANNDRARSDANPFSQGDVAQNLRPGPDYDVAAYRRVAFALFVSGPPERDALVDQNIVADLRRLANHDPMP